MTEKSWADIHWQPIESLSLIRSMVDGLLDETEKQYANLESCRSKPHVLDDYTVDRVINLYTDQAGDLRLYEEPTFLAWLKERVLSPDPDAEAFKIAAYGHLRAQRLEPPATDRFRRLLRMAVGLREQQLVADIGARLSPAMRCALDALVNTQAPGQPVDADQICRSQLMSRLLPIDFNAIGMALLTTLPRFSTSVPYLHLRLEADDSGWGIRVSHCESSSNSHQPQK